MKTSKKLLSLLLTAYVAVCGNFVFAAEKNSSDLRPRYALVIGNQNYEKSSLDNTISDAELIKKVLEDCAFEVFYYTDCNNLQLRQAVVEYSKIVNAAGTDVISLFYYSGHGVQIDSENYIVGTDDAGIQEEAEAKAFCFKVNSIFDFVKAKTQVFILDACRDNPFKSSKEKFAKGLSAINAPKTINFTYLFSTQAGDVAADGGAGKNSLFTSVLAEEIGKYNVPVSSVFSSVCTIVQDRTENRQRPMYTGSSVDFYFMNEAIADLKIARLKQQMAENEASLKKETDNTKKNDYKTEQQVLQAKVKAAEDQRARVKADAEEKAQKAKEQAERDKKLRAETEQLRKQTEKLKKEKLAMMAKQQSSTSLIEQIQSDIARVQEIRKIALAEIIAADKATEKIYDEKIQEVLTREVSIIDKDNAGNLTDKAIKKRNAEIAAIKAECDKEKAANEKLYHDTIREEETSLLNAIDTNRKALQKATYIASSVLDEARFAVVNQFDGSTNKWTIVVISNLFNNQSLVNTKIDLSYSGISGIKNPNYDADDYPDKVEALDFQLRDPELRSLFDVRYEYTIKPVAGKDSVYSFNATKVQVYYSDSDDIEKSHLVNSKKITSIPTQITWDPVSKLETISEMYTAYQKKVEADRKAEAERQKQYEQAEEERIRQNEKHLASIEKERERQERKEDFNRKLDYWGGTQEPIEGLTAALALSTPGTFGLELGWNFAIGDHFFAGPFATVGTVTYPYNENAEYIGESPAPNIGAGGIIGGGVTYRLSNGDYLELYGFAKAKICSRNGFGFTFGPGIEYVLDSSNVFAVGANLGLEFTSVNGAGFLFSVTARTPLDTLVDLFTY
ncbi:MAG: caspase family protein [Treponema sp.]|nr:caspase family protein [Treponema sp.]